MLGTLFTLDDPIFNGVATRLLFGIFVSTLLKRDVLRFFLQYGFTNACPLGSLLKKSGVSEG